MRHLTEMFHISQNFNLEDSFTTILKRIIGDKKFTNVTKYEDRMNIYLECDLIGQAYSVDTLYTIKERMRAMSANVIPGTPLKLRLILEK